LIDSQTIERIIDAARIEEVVGDFVSLRRRGANLIGLCPFHSEKTGSFSVSPARGIFKCFGCGEGGNSVNFVMKHEHLSYPEALKYLANKYNIEVIEKELTSEEKEKQSERASLLHANSFAADFYAKYMSENPTGIAIGKSYFYERGISEQTIEKFKLGYAPEKNVLIDEAKRNGISAEILLKAGLVGQSEDGRYYDRFRDRVMFPIHSPSGQIVGFGGRILQKKENVGKYINSPDTDVYNKSRELYGVYLAANAIAKANCCYLVEGNIDVLSMFQTGLQNTVASCGTALTPEQVRLIKRYTQNITVIYDGDEAGIKATMKAINLILSEGMNVRTVLLPDGDDPDSFAKKHNADEVINYLTQNQTDFIRYKINVSEPKINGDPIKQAEMISDIIKDIAVVPDELLREEYAKECSKLLNISIETIYGKIGEIKRLKVSSNEYQVSRQDQQALNQKNENLIPDTKILNTKNNKIDRLEKELLIFAIKCGKTPIVYADNEQSFTAAEFIAENFKAANLKFSNPFYENIFYDFVEKVSSRKYQIESTENRLPDAHHSLLDNNKEIETYFKYHPDPQVSQFAAEIFIEQYTLSNIYKEKEHILEELPVPPDEDNFEDVHTYNDALEDYTRRERLFVQEQNLMKRKEQEKIEELLSKIIRVFGEYVNELALNEKKRAVAALRATPLQETETINQIQQEIVEINRKIKEFSKPLGNRAIVKIL
jgi:DNA primase